MEEGECPVVPEALKRYFARQIKRPNASFLTGTIAPDRKDVRILARDRLLVRREWNPETERSSASRHCAFGFRLAWTLTTITDGVRWPTVSCLLHEVGHACSCWEQFCEPSSIPEET